MALSRAFTAFLVLFLLLPIFAFADGNLSVNGYYKSFFTVFDSAIQDDEPLTGAVSNRLRLNLFYEPVDWVSFSAAYSISPQVKTTRSSLMPFNPFDYRITDVDSRLYPAEGDKIKNFGVYQNLDRALITLNLPMADIRIGRQAIAWGSARAINPTDVLAPFTLTELDVEERRGVDAIRVFVPISMMQEIDVGAVFGEDPKESAFYLRGKFYIAQSDISIILANFRENLLTGVDIARSIGGAGFWLEAGEVFSDMFRSDAEVEKYFRGSVGFDYSFSGETYAFAEYHWNQAGSNNPDEYISNLLDNPAYNEGSVFLMGQHYIMPGLSYQITPLITSGAELLVNIGDPSIFISSQLEYNIKQDIYLSVGTFIGIGKKPKSAIQLNSEFGSYEDIYFTSFRIYF